MNRYTEEQLQEAQISLQKTMELIAQDEKRDSQKQFRQRLYASWESLHEQQLAMQKSQEMWLPLVGKRFNV